MEINLIFNQPYYPQYNGIELFWSICKQKFKKAALSILTGNSTEIYLRKIIAPKMQAVPRETVIQCMESSLRLIN